MSATQRIVLLALAAVVAVGAFFLLRPDTAPPEHAASRDTRSATPATTAPEKAPATTTAPRAEARPRRRAGPAVTRVRVRGGAPVGGVERIRVESGDTVRFTVSADSADEVHVHGYDIERQVGPGKTARFRFPARLEGLFEVELHGSGAEIAELEVRPG